MNSAADPVGVREIAERLGVRQQTVAQWKYKGLMPDAPWVVSGYPCWPWDQIEQWARRTGRISE